MSFSARATVTAATVAHGSRSATLEDFRAHAPSGTYVFMPCRETWTARAVDIVVGRQQVFDKHGKPVRNTKGELVTESASSLAAETSARRTDGVGSRTARAHS